MLHALVLVIESSNWCKVKPKATILKSFGKIGTSASVSILGEMQMSRAVKLLYTLTKDGNPAKYSNNQLGCIQLSDTACVTQV